MATDKPRVQGYLDPEVYQHLEKFQADRKLKESAALNQILREYFGLEPFPPQASSADIEGMIKEALNQALSNDDKLQRLVEGAVVAYWNHSIVEFNARLEALEATVKPIEGLAEISHPVSEPPSELPSELNLSQLARRLRVVKSVISRRKSRSDFEQWAKGKDPDAIAWEYDGENQKFFPIGG